MSLLKKLLSFLYPQTTIVDSQHSGKVEITWYNGKKMLDTENANYSYGSLQEVLEYGIHQIDLKHINSILILGMGAGSIIKSLSNKFNYQKTITAVEFDKSIIDIAANEFNIKPSKNLNIIHNDASQFLIENKEKYDLLIVDLFIDKKVPHQFIVNEFLENLQNTIYKNGFLIFNTMGISSSKLEKVKSTLSKNLNIDFHAIKTHENILMIGKKF